jgi:hypothetical protein
MKEVALNLEIAFQATRTNPMGSLRSVKVTAVDDNVATFKQSVPGHGLAHGAVASFILVNTSPAVRYQCFGKSSLTRGAEFPSLQNHSKTTGSINFEYAERRRMRQRDFRISATRTYLPATGNAD